MSKYSLDDKESKRIVKDALIVSFFTALSRSAGLIRDILIFHIFGVGIITDAFFMAFTIPNTLRRFIAEGALTFAFIPVYTEIMDNDGKMEAKYFLRVTLCFVLIVLFFLVVFGFFYSKYFVYLFASGFMDNKEKIDLTISLTRILFIYVIFVSLLSLSMGVLNAHKHFIAPAASPILLNIFIILSTIFLTKFFLKPIFAVAIGVIIGGVFQLILQIFFLSNFNLLILPKFDFKFKPFKKLINLLIPSIFGIAIYQLNLLILRQFGSYLPDGQISYYYNADRLMQFTLGVFAISVSTVILPSISSKNIRNNKNALFKTWIFSFKLTNFIIIPAAFSLFSMSIPIVSVLYLHGNFNLIDVKVTAYTTMAFAPALIAIAIIRTTVQIFFLLDDVKTPVYIGILIVFINIIIGLLLLSLYEVVGLGATFSISSLIQSLILVIILMKKFNYLYIKELFKSIIMQLILAFFASFGSYFILMFGNWNLGANIINIIVLFSSIIFFIIFYIIMALKLKSSEARIIYNILFSS